ncbi:MAG: hypothetical protein F6J98_23615 [Moorea sp. SIO4G2]|nr:hypothetical protein [Moorena sp. SIO4G2]
MQSLMAHGSVWVTCVRTAVCPVETPFGRAASLPTWHSSLVSLHQSPHTPQPVNLLIFLSPRQLDKFVRG